MSFSITVTQTMKRDTDDTIVIAKRTLSGLTKRMEREDVVNNAAKVLWTSGSLTPGELATWKLLLLKSDVDIEVELTVNEDDADQELSHFTLEANTTFVLGSQVSRDGHTGGRSFNGSLDVIDKIKVKEINSVDATVDMRLYA